MQRGFEYTAIGGVAAAITQPEPAPRSGVAGLPIVEPPPQGAVASKLTGVVALSQIDMPVIALQVLPAVRNPRALRRAGKILVKGAPGLLHLELAGAIEIAQLFLFLRVNTQNRRTRSGIVAAQPNDVLKLLVALRRLVKRG